MAVDTETGYTNQFQAGPGSSAAQSWKTSPRLPGTPTYLFHALVHACYPLHLSALLSFRPYQGTSGSYPTCAVPSSQNTMNSTVVYRRWVVPLLWGPVLVICLALSLASRQLHTASILALVIAGGLLWQLMEYCIHRCLFHAVPSSYWGITAHFMFHGCHHKFPMDDARLVFPPLPAAAVAAGIWSALRAALPQVRFQATPCLPCYYCTVAKTSCVHHPSNVQAYSSVLKACPAHCKLTSDRWNRERESQAQWLFM